MSIVFYEPPPCAVGEARRERAVEASGALDARDDAILCDIAVETRKRFGAFTAAVSIVHGEYQHLIAASGMPTGLYARRTSLCGHAVAGNERLFELPDVAADPRFAGNPWVNGEEGTVGFYAAALLRDADDQALGALCVTDIRPRRPLTEMENADLRHLADRALHRLEELRGPAEA